MVDQNNNVIHVLISKLIPQVDYCLFFIYLGLNLFKYIME